MYFRKSYTRWTFPVTSNFKYESSAPGIIAGTFLSIRDAVDLFVVDLIEGFFDVDFVIVRFEILLAPPIMGATETVALPARLPADPPAEAKTFSIKKQFAII